MLRTTHAMQMCVHISSLSLHPECDQAVLLHGVLAGLQVCMQDLPECHCVSSLLAAGLAAGQCAAQGKARIISLPKLAAHMAPSGLLPSQAVSK